MRKKAKAAALTPLELELMKVLWELGSATVQQVHQGIQGVRPLAYNTVQTVLTILHRKGRVKRKTAQRAYVYSAAASRDKTAVQALGDLIDRMFGGRPEALVLSMVKNGKLSEEQLAGLRRTIEEGVGDGDA